QKRALVEVGRRGKLLYQGGLDRPRRLPEVVVRRAVAETLPDAVQPGIDRQNRMIRREEQHAVRAGLAELREWLQRPPGRRQRTLDDCGQRGRPPEQIDADSERAQAVLEIRAGQRHALR